MQQQLRENPMMVAGIALLAIGMAMKFQSGDFQRQSQLGSKVKEARFGAELNQRLLEVSQDTEKNKAAIAEQRYQSGCVMVFSSDPTKLNYFTALSEGKPVMDGARSGAIVADGTIVCDALGNSAKIINGVAADFAFTPNRKVVADAMQRYSGSPVGPNRFSAPRM